MSELNIYKEEGQGDNDIDYKENENKNYTNNFKKPSYYSNKLNELDQRFNIIINSYIDNLKKNNLNDEVKTQFDDLNNNLFVVTFSVVLCEYKKYYDQVE